jgi:hypothetical protein
VDRGPRSPPMSSRRPQRARRDAMKYATNRRAVSRPRGLRLGRPRAVAHGGPVSAQLLRVGEGGDAVRDAQTDVPSARRLRAQLAFKDSMVHGILQFTPSIAFRYVLHRCESRDIRCRESFSIQWKTAQPPTSRGRAGRRASLRFGSLAHAAPGYVVCRAVRALALSARRRCSGGHGCAPRPPGLYNGFAGRSAVQVSTMILPQVHLRKPCYDFSFL